jgi:hypothetical protein
MLRPFLVVALVSAVSASAQAAPPAEALKTCLADNTSGKDRKDLARWIFLAMAAHPEMKQHASATASTAANEASRTMAALVTRLLTDSCVNETRAVMKTGQGAQSMELAFQGLGQLAMQELMADKVVQDSMGVFERYLDQQRLSEILAVK